MTLPTPDPRDEVIDRVDELLNQYERLFRAEEPIWHGQEQMANTLVTLASGALVLTISATQFFMDRTVSPAWPWLIPASWVLFAITVVCGALRHGHASTARSWLLAIEAARDAIKAKMMDLDAGPDLEERADKVYRKVLNRSLRESQKAVKTHNILVHLMFWPFAGGLVALVVFAVRNLPF